MSDIKLNRRLFTRGALATLGTGLISPMAFGQETLQSKTITTSAGTYDIPLAPKRVIAVDHRLDLEPALALGLTVIGYSLRDNLAPWVPVADGTAFIGSPPTQELFLSLEPDLIFCTDLPGSKMWPIELLSDVAPVIPIDYELDWKDNLARAGEWMDRSDLASAFIADYQAMIDALRAKAGDKLDRKVAAVWYSQDDANIQVLLGAGTKNVTLAGQVLHDLGGVTLDEGVLGEYGMVSMEQAPDVLADVEAILIDSSFDEQRAAMEASPIWQRVPAVAAGKVYNTTGTFYGGGYSAKRLVGEWEQLFELI